MYSEDYHTGWNSKSKLWGSGQIGKGKHEKDSNIQGLSGFPTCLVLLKNYFVNTAYNIILILRKSIHLANILRFVIQILTQHAHPTSWISPSSSIFVYAGFSWLYLPASAAFHFRFGYSLEICCGFLQCGTFYLIIILKCLYINHTGVFPGGFYPFWTPTPFPRLPSQPEGVSFVNLLHIHKKTRFSMPLAR